jgi:thymidylate synthase (FAD)
MKDEFYVPKQFRLQSNQNHQGSDGLLDQETNLKFQNRLIDHHSQTFEQYKLMLESNVSREMSRIILPLSTYTSFFWKIDLHNLLKFLRLRMDPTAQEEIRVYADEIWKIVQIWVPASAKSFENHYLESVKLSSNELEVLRSVFSNLDHKDIKQKINGSDLIKKRQKDKLVKLLFAD